MNDAANHVDTTIPADSTNYGAPATEAYVPVASPIMKANDIQVDGSHYRGKNADYQHWDLVADVGMGYFDGQITKYVSRWRDKNGLKDLKKSHHFCIKYLEVLEARKLVTPRRENALFTVTCLNRYLDAQQVAEKETVVVATLTKTHEKSDVAFLINYIGAMISVEEERLAALAATAKHNRHMEFIGGVAWAHGISIEEAEARVIAKQTETAAARSLI